MTASAQVSTASLRASSWQEEIRTVFWVKVTQQSSPEGSWHRSWGAAGLAGAVPDGLAAHRGLEGRIREDLGGVRLERGDRRGLERDGPDALAIDVGGVHLRDGVLAVPDDRVGDLPVGARIPDAPEGVVGDDALDEGVKRRYGGDRDSEVPDRRFVHGLLHEVCHGVLLLPARCPRSEI